jgi:hypothetical protein
VISDLVLATLLAAPCFARLRSLSCEELLGWTHLDLARFIADRGFDLLDAPADQVAEGMLRMLGIPAAEAARLAAAPLPETGARR